MNKVLWIWERLDFPSDKHTGPRATSFTTNWTVVISSRRSELLNPISGSNDPTLTETQHPTWFYMTMTAVTGYSAPCWHWWSRRMKSFQILNTKTKKYFFLWTSSSMTDFKKTKTRLLMTETSVSSTAAPQSVEQRSEVRGASRVFRSSSLWLVPRCPQRSSLYGVQRSPPSAPAQWLMVSYFLNLSRADVWLDNDASFFSFSCLSFSTFILSSTVCLMTSWKHNRVNTTAATSPASPASPLPAHVCGLLTLWSSWATCFLRFSIRPVELRPFFLYLGTNFSLARGS